MFLTYMLMNPIRMFKTPTAATLSINPNVYYTQTTVDSLLTTENIIDSASQDRLTTTLKLIQDSFR
jgi:hypothetical protein